MSGPLQKKFVDPPHIAVSSTVLESDGHELEFQPLASVSLSTKW